MAYKIVLDAGHGGIDAGGVYNGRVEKDDALNLALAVGEILAYNGIDVYYTRVYDEYLSHLARAQIANVENADLIISLNRSISPAPNTTNGVKSAIYEEGGLSQTIAESINTELSNMGFNILGIDIKPNLTVLSKTIMPAVLVDVGFINSDYDNLILDERFSDVAYAIAVGILNGLETSYDQPVSNSNGRMYRVQVGLFRDPVNAYNLRSRLEDLGYTVDVVTQGELLSVQVGLIKTIERAQEIERLLRSQGFDTLIVSVNN